MTLLLFIHFPASICKCRDTLMYSIYGREESNASQEKLCYIILYFKEKQLSCENYFIVFIIFMGITTSLCPLITLFRIPFICTPIHLTGFYSVSIFNRFIQLVSVMLSHALINFHVWLILVHVLVSTLFVHDLWILS